MFSNILIYYFELDKKDPLYNSTNYVSDIAYKVLYNLVEKLYSIDKDRLTIARGLYGKPYFINYKDLHFNISHSDNKIVCAISTTPIGVDIEKISSPNLMLAKRFFLPLESFLIFSAKLKIMKTLCFYTIWTRKEAYVKNIGKGLSIRLNSFNVLDASTNYEFYTTIKINSVISICYSGKNKLIFKHIKKRYLKTIIENYKTN